MANLVVETGAGVAGANSYATVSEADSYFADSLNGDRWLAIEDQDRKQNALIFATRVLENEVARVSGWFGYRTTSTQALSFPRTGLYTSDGNSVPDTSIPYGVKEAVFVIARRLVLNPDLADDDGGEVSVNLGSTSVTYGAPRGMFGGSVYLTPSVMMSVGPFMDSQKRMVRA